MPCSLEQQAVPLLAVKRAVLPLAAKPVQSLQVVKPDGCWPVQDWQAAPRLAWQAPQGPVCGPGRMAAKHRECSIAQARKPQALLIAPLRFCPGFPGPGPLRLRALQANARQRTPATDNDCD